MIVLYTEKFSKKLVEEYKHKEVFFIDNNINKLIVSKKFIIPYKRYCKDIRLNSIYSTFIFLNQYQEKIKFFFDIDLKNNLFSSFKCIDSFIKRRILKNKISNFIFLNSFDLYLFDIDQIIMLSNFFIKTGVVSNSENFFDVCYNYYFYLNSKKDFIK